MSATQVIGGTGTKAHPARSLHLLALRVQALFSTALAAVRADVRGRQNSAPTENLGLHSAPEETQPHPQPVGPGAPAQAVSPADEFPPGTVLRDRYVIEHPIGLGGTSMVFKAHDRHRAGRSTADSCVAVKILLPKYRTNAGAVQRMKREFHQMQRLTHRNIARVFDLDCHDGIWFMTMQLMQGQTLYQRLRNPTASAEALSLIEQCADALIFAHEQGVVHGDLKPGNIFIAPNGHVQLFDFGCAREHRDDLDEDTCARSIAATLPYASPQVLAGRRPEPSDDVFSLACLAYEVMAQGEHPFLRKCTLDARRDGLLPAPTRNIARPQFDALVHGLAWERKARPQTVRRFMQELQAHRSTRARVLKWKGKILWSSGHRAFGLQTAGLAVVTTVVVAVILTVPQVRSTPTPLSAASFAPTAAIAMPVALAPPEESRTREAIESSPPNVRPKAPGTVSIDAAVISVGYAQSMAVVTLKRLKSTRGRARFAWSTVEGTARPGIDYKSVRSQIAQFADGQTIRTLYVPLLHRGDDSTSAHSARSFFVRLEHVPGSPVLGPVTKAEVQVAGISDYYLASNKN